MLTCTLGVACGCSCVRMSTACPWPLCSEAVSPRIVGTCRPGSPNHTWPPERSRLRRLRQGRLAIVHGRQLCAVAAGSVLVLRLLGRWLDVILASRSLFLGARLGGGSTRAAVKAGVVFRSVVDDGLVVGVLNVRDVYVVDGAVVVEDPAVPITAEI